MNAARRTRRAAAGQRPAGRLTVRQRQPAQWRMALALTLAWLGAFAANVAADVTARLEPAIIDELETTRLVLQAGGTTPETLDLAALAADFEVLGTQTASRYRTENGIVDASVEYQITLRPTRTGELRIPPIAIGAAASPPLTLVVRAIDPVLRAAIDRMVFFEVELTRNPVYLRSETVLVRRLYYSSATQIYSDLPAAPELPGVLVLPIGETRSTTAVRHGERYGVIEQRFALFPERPGTLTIPSISLTSSVRLQVEGRTRRTGARVSTPPLTVEVLPVPPEYPADTPWLPATAVDLRDEWSPDHATVQVGEPLARRITIAVTGNLAAAIAPPEDRLPDPHFRQYPEPPQLADDRSGRSVTGTRRTVYAIVPTAPGNVALPGLSITWWDVEAQQVRTTRTADRPLAIAGDAPPPPPGASASAPAAGATVAAAGTADSAGPDSARNGQLELRGWSGVALLLATVTLLAFLMLRSGNSARRDAAARQLRRGLERAGLLGDRRGLARRRHLRRLRARLSDSSRDGGSATVERALVGYLACWYRTSPAQAVERFAADGHALLIERLQAARFGPTPGAPPTAAELIAAIDALRPARAVSPDPLPELFGAP